MATLAVLFVVFALASGCRTQPTLDSSERVVDVFAGVADVFFLRADDTLWATGYNHEGQLGVGHITQRGIIPAGETPSLARIYGDAGEPFSGARFVAAGENHAVILRNDGSIWGAGDSSRGELGMQGGQHLVFVRLNMAGAPPSGATAIAAGNNSTFFISTDNSLWAAGFNHFGELGLGNRDAQFSFAQVERAGNNASGVASGMHHTALLKTDGTLWVAGHNFNGQLGLGDTDDRTSFTEVASVGANVIAVAAGNNHTVILKGDGSVWAAGSNFWGQIGFDDNSDRHTFTRLADSSGRPLTGIREIAARGDMTLILAANGSLLLTGNYADPMAMLEMAFAEGRLSSLRTTFAPLVPEQQAGRNFAQVQRIVLGNNSIHVIDSNGRLWAAGSNRHGQLGLGFDTEISPVLRLVNP
ncbi:MAG: hypothetical protein FWC65_01350 [Treponema sp.]|nr:hypothetical protein [Treponema sp.]